MGFSDNFAALSTILFSSFGESITYIPADGSPSFAGTAVFSQIQINDESMRDAIRDTMQCRILHSDLIDNGISSPTVQQLKQSGDSITRTNMAGDSETWDIVSAEPNINLAEWTLILEKNLRFAPS
jgi:hypothetical protein